MAKMSFDEEGLLEEPCLSCDKPRLDNLFYEWYCDEKECPYEDAISRQAVLDGIEKLKQSPWATDKRGNGFEYLITEALDIVADLCVKQEPSVRAKPETVTEFADRCRECGARYGKLLKAKTEYLGKCSVCGRGRVIDGVCSYCGCRMVEPTCDTCKYTTAAFNPCNGCKDKSEYEPQESEEK